MTQLMREVRFFNGMSEQDRSDLLGFMREKQYAAGETICVRGEPGTTMFVVVHGSLALLAPGKDNLPQEIARIAQGAVLGEMFCLDPAPRPATVVAAENSAVLELSRDSLTKMRQDAPEAASALVYAVLREVLLRLRRVDDRVERELLAEEESYDEREFARQTEESMPSSSDLDPGPWEACFARFRGTA